MTQFQSAASDAPGVPEAATLRFNSDLGCILPLVALTVLFVGFAAARPDLIDGHSRFAALVAETRPFSVGGVNVVILALALYALWGFFTLGTRWADGVAARATSEGVTFHWTLLRRGIVPWSEVRGAELGTTLVRWTRVPEVRVQLADRVVSIRAFEEDEGAAERFVAMVRARAACCDGGHRSHGRHP